MERGRGRRETAWTRNKFEVLQGIDLDVDDEDEQKEQQQQQVIPSLFCKDGNEFQTTLCTSAPNRVYLGIQSEKQLCRVEQININKSHALLSKKFQTTLSVWLSRNPFKTRLRVLFHNQCYPSPLVTTIIQALMISYSQFHSNPNRSPHKFLHLARSYVLNIALPYDPNNLSDLYNEYKYTVAIDIVYVVPLSPDEIKDITEKESIVSLIFDQILEGTDSFNGWVWSEWVDFRHTLKNTHNLTYAVNHPVLLPWRKRLNLIDSLVMKLRSSNNQLKFLIRDVLADMEMFEQDWEDTIKDDAPFMSVLYHHVNTAAAAAAAGGGVGVGIDPSTPLSLTKIKQRRGIRLLQLIRNSDHHLHDKKPREEDSTGTEFKHLDKNKHTNYLDKRYICFKFLCYFPKLMPQLCSSLVKHDVKYWEFL